MGIRLERHFQRCDQRSHHGCADGDRSVKEIDGRQTMGATHRVLRQLAIGVMGSPVVVVVGISS